MAMSWSKRLLFVGLLMGGAFGGAVYLGLIPSEGAARAQHDQPPQLGAASLASDGMRPLELAPVEVVTLQPTSMIERLRVSGELRPVNRVVLKTKVGGTVTDVAVRAGQPVKAGDVVVRFQTDDLESALLQRTANLEASRAQLILAEQTLEKTQELSRRGFSTRAALEKAQSDVAAGIANVQSLAAQADTARSALRDAEILAPFDGVVASRSIEPGVVASANAELLTIVDTSVLEAEVLVSTRDITRLQIGQVSELRIDGLDGQIVKGIVDRINPMANEGSRFVPVHLRLENHDGELWGGMFASGTIVVRERADAFFLPSTSLREDAGGMFVLKLEAGQLRRQPVVPAGFWSGGNTVEIGEGIASGDVVVVAPLSELRPEMAATVMDEAG